MGLYPVKQWSDDDTESERLYAIWSTYIDNFIGLDFTRDEIVEFFAEKAELEARWHYNGILNCLEGVPRDPKDENKPWAYCRPDETFEDLLKRHIQMKDNCENPEFMKKVRGKLKELKNRKIVKNKD